MDDSQHNAIVYGLWSMVYLIALLTRRDDYYSISPEA
jgi:hypothetical protein